MRGPATMIPAVLRRAGSRRTTRALRAALRTVRSEFQISTLHLASVKRASVYRGRMGLKLNLGCGPNLKQGWVNIDLSPEAELQLDLREPLPFDDGSVAMIYSEHLFEHLEYPNTWESGAWSGLEHPGHPSEALALLRESLRVLMPGGTFSVVVPDAERVLRAYATGDREVFETDARTHPAWCDTVLHHVNFTFRQGREHRYAWDGETLMRVLEHAGFRPVTRREFDPELDTASRQIGSLYVDAQKPA